MIEWLVRRGDQFKNVTEIKKLAEFVGQYVGGVDVGGLEQELRRGLSAISRDARAPILQGGSDPRFGEELVYLRPGAEVEVSLWKALKILEALNAGGGDVLGGLVRMLPYMVFPESSCWYCSDTIAVWYQGRGRLEALKKAAEKGYTEGSPDFFEEYLRVLLCKPQLGLSGVAVDVDPFGEPRQVYFMEWRWC